MKLLIITALILGFFGISCSSTSAEPSPKQEQRPLLTFGEGAPLKYLVLGDSTAAAVGGTYERGIVMETTRHLARNGRVEMLNLSVSGAKMADVRNDQLARRQGFRPDLVLVDAGANDVIRLTSSSSIERDLVFIVETLIAENCDVKIVVTGSPDMGAPPRIPFLLRGLAAFRSRRLNVMAKRAAAHYQLTFAPIAERTGPIFRSDPSLFAADRFHQTDQGYAVWVPVLNEALDKALAEQPSHCATTR